MKNNRSVERALSVLLYVCQSETSKGLTEISRATNLDKATTLRLIKTLADADMVCHEPGTRRYQQGPGIYNFWPSEMRKICRPSMQTLLDQVNETICVIALRGNKRICIDSLEPDRELRIVAPIGRELPVFVGASGRIFMAYKSEKQRQSILDGTKLRVDTLDVELDKEIYLEQLEEVREAGCAHNVGEVADGTSTIAAPIFDSLGNTAAALVVRGPSTRMSEDVIDGMAKLVKTAAGKISEEMAKMKT